MIKQYRKKLIIYNDVEAVQFTRNNWDEIVEFTKGNAFNVRIEKRIGGRCNCSLKGTTLPFPVFINENDYIFKTLENDILYTCDAINFNIKYDEVIDTINIDEDNPLRKKDD